MKALVSSAGKKRRMVYRLRSQLLIFASLEAVLALETAALVDDPCTYHVCQVGEVCKPVYNHLLQVPVAACHEVGTHHHSTGKCKTFLKINKYIISVNG